MALTFPFAAIVGQDEMTLAIQVVAVDPSIGGVLVLGDRGTGKSTAVRALADLLLQLAPHQQVELLVGATEFDIALERHRVVALDERIKELVNGDRLA